jgi:hypothetical protein
MKNKKVLFLISSELFHRNYVETGVVSFLAQNYAELVILAEESVSSINHNSVIRYSIDKQHEIKHYQFLKILSWRYRYLSRTFKYRFKRTSQFNFKKTSNFDDFSNSCKINFISLKRRAKILFLGNFLLFPLVRYFFKKKLQPKKQLTNIINHLQPDVVLMPSSAYDPIVMDLINITKLQSIKSILLVDNWDNLSSKSILWELPDAVTVWGEQTRQHAVTIQQFKDEQISCIGTPRFKNYLKLRDKDLPSHFEFEYILFVGQSLPSDELTIIKNLNDLLCSKQFSESGIKLVYRPHPWAMEQGLPDLSELDAVILDPQIIAKDPLRKNIVSFQPSLEYYPSLLQNAKFVVSSLTSMIIEASIFRKNIIAICHKEPGNYTSPDRVFMEYMHFDGIERLPNLTLSMSNSELRQHFIKFFTIKDHSPSANLDTELRHFIIFQGSYTERLKNCIDRYL